MSIFSRTVLSTGLLVPMLACSPEQSPTEPSDTPSLAQVHTRTYTAVDLGTIAGGTRTYALAINAAGQVVGASTLPSGDTHAFRWERGVMTDLGTLGGSNSTALGINDAGHVVGYSERADGEVHAFLWKKGFITDLGTVDGRRSTALDINAHGLIVGGADGIPLLWKKGVRVRLRLPAGGTYCEASSINAAGRAVGQCTINDNARAVLWERGRVSDLGTLGGSFATATGINAQGAVIGISAVAFDNGTHPFLWKRGRMTDLTTRGAPAGFIPNGINARGQIAGHYGGGDYLHAVLWQRGTTVELGAPGIDSYVADINARGQVVGYTVGGDEYHAVLWKPTSPDPEE